MNNRRKSRTEAQRARDDLRLKSWIWLIVGLAGLLYQQWSGDVYWILSIIFTVMTGIPMASSIISLLMKSPTIIQSSLSQQLPSEQESPNVSAPSEDEV